MPSGDLSRALSAWTAGLGAEHVVSDPEGLESYRRNVTGLERDIPAVLRPGDLDDVRLIVRIANEHAAPLYPISCGRNWGLGSRLPVRNGSVVVDLGRMNRIHEVDQEHRYAVIEPGVTQQQLYAYLRNRDLPLQLNVTGTSMCSSVIGNALERGIGYFSSRADELTGLEVVLGNGNVIRTGFGHFPDCALTHLYPYGVGPSIDGLFQQGNFGIVVRAGVRLLPKAEARLALICRIDTDDRLVSFLDVVAGLYRDGVMNTVMHIGNRHRTEAALGPLIAEHVRDRKEVAQEQTDEEVRRFLQAEGYGAWSAIAGIHGTRTMVQAACKEIRRALRGIARPVFLSQPRLHRLIGVLRVLRFLPSARRKLAVLPSVLEIHGLSQGIPTSETMKSLYWPLREPLPDGDDMDPDQSRCGMIYFLPMMPLRGAHAREAMQIVREAFRPGGFDPYVTFNVIDSRTLEAVIDVHFDRSKPDETAAAHRAIDAVQQGFMERGWYPYRVAIDRMNSVVSEDDVFWQTIRDLKAVLDPNRIISPGRYNLS